MGKEEAREQAKTLLKGLGLEEKMNSLAEHLSGGMKRRLNIAMALIHDPEIVVLDEPVAGLDPQSRLLVMEYIKSLKDRGKTVILTTHLMEIADQLSDRVAIIDHGKLLVLDTPESLKNRVGQGDTLELTLYDADRNLDAVKMLKQMDGIQDVMEFKGRIVLRALDAAGKLPRIFKTLADMNIKILDLSLRRNTLEDVFISLTGRSLRE